jgi:hypothetical protein
MALRTPQNQIISSKYTTGNEYMFKSTQKEYQGYYYEMNGKVFAGKEFNPVAYELVKITFNNTNLLLSLSSTLIYGLLSKFKPNNILPTSVIAGKSGKDGGLKYFYKKINVSPITIKETDEETYKKLKNTPLYQFVTVFYNEFNLPDPDSLNQAEKILPGISSFINSIPPPLD